MFDPAADADGPDRVPHFSGLDTRLIVSVPDNPWMPTTASNGSWAFQSPETPFLVSGLDEDDDAFEDEDDLDEEEDDLYDDEDEDGLYDDEDSYFFPDDE